MTEHVYEVGGEWQGGSNGQGRLHAAALECSMTWPPELGGPAGELGRSSGPAASPEDLLLGAANSCYILTFVAMAERLGLPVRRVRVQSSLRVRNERGLVAEQLRHGVVVTVTLEDERVRRRVLTTAHQAERGCMVARALRGNVEIGVDVEVLVEEDAKVRFRQLVALGDSMTAGPGDETDGARCRPWVECFAERMRHDGPTFEVVNLASHGKKLHDVLAEQLEPALGHAPELVSVMVGGNDLRTRRWKPEPFEHDLRLMLERLAAGSQPVVLLATVPDFALALPFSSFEIKRAMQRSIRAANAIIARVAHDTGALLVGLHDDPATYDLDNYSEDFLHPNARGHELIGALVFEILERAHGPHATKTTPLEDDR